MTLEPTVVEVRAPGRPGSPVRVMIRVGLLAPRILRVDARSVDIALAGTRALLLGDDDLQIDVRVEAGLRLTLRDVAGTVAYAGRGRPSSWTARLDVGQESRLTWLAEPFVVAGGARVRRATSANVAAGGGVLLRECTVLGRAREDDASLITRTEMSYDHRLAMLEELDMTVESRAGLPDRLRPPRVVDQVVRVGAATAAAPPLAVTGIDKDEGLSTAAHRFHYPGGVLVDRWLGEEAHLSPLPAFVTSQADW